MLKQVHFHPQHAQSNDIEIIEGYFDFVCIRPSIRDSWNRLKKELSGSGQNSAEETQPQAGTQQLKAKIAALVEAHFVFEGDECVDYHQPQSAGEELRQLSAV